jgi:hypothetical protein
MLLGLDPSTSTEVSASDKPFDGAQDGALRRGSGRRSSTGLRTAFRTGAKIQGKGGDLTIPLERYSIY